MTTGGKKLSMGKQNELIMQVNELLRISFDDCKTVDEQFQQFQEMYGIVERIRMVESELKIKISNGQSRAANVEAFCSWAHDNGCQFEGVRIVEYPFYGMGLEAMRDFEQLEMFITVPKKMIFRVQNDAMVGEILKLMAGAMLREQGNVMLALLLIIERFNKESFWRPYLDILPDRYSTVLYFTPADMAELKETSAFLPALNLYKNIVRQYCFVKRMIQSKVDTLKNNFTFDIYRWSVSTVMTRQNKIPIDLSDREQDSSLVLIPFWDMANHKSILSSFQTGYNEQLERVESFTQERFPKGSQIFIKYGERTDADFLVHNGFVVVENVNTLVTKRFVLSKMYKLYDERLRLLGLLGLSDTGDFGFDRGPDYLSPELCAFVRVFCMTKEQLEWWLAAGDEQREKLRDPQFPMEQDITDRVYNYLSIRVQIILRLYPTTLEQDEDQLKSNRKLNHIRRMILQYKVNEKKTVQAFLEHITSTLSSG